MAFGPEARAKVAWLDVELEGDDADDEDLELGREFVSLLQTVVARWPSKRK